MPSFNVRSPFGFLITNVILKNEKKSWQFLYYNNMIMYIKKNYFLIFLLAMANLSYNVNC
jgi:hypothetical protein